MGIDGETSEMGPSSGEIDLKIKAVAEALAVEVISEITFPEGDDASALEKQKRVAENIARVIHHLGKRGLKVDVKALEDYLRIDAAEDTEA
jgi:hypothetical protein